MIRKNRQIVKSKIFDKYGGKGHLKAPPRELIFSQTENYVEYSGTGKWQNKSRYIAASNKTWWIPNFLNPSTEW